MRHKISMLNYLDLNKLFQWTITQKEVSGYGTFFDFMVSLKALIVSIIIQKGTLNKVHFNKESRILFYLANGIVRSDINQMMINVSNYVGDDSQYDYLCWKSKLIIKPSRVLMNILLLPLYIYNTRKLDVNIALRLLLVTLLYEIKDRETALLKLTDIEKYNLCVVDYDAYTYGNHIVQLFKNLGVATATLQHGVMLARRPELKDNPDYLGIEFQCSISDYFLAWNEFTKKEAIKNGMDPDKIKVLGQCKKDFGEKTIQLNDKKKIGIILDGLFEEENNRTIIGIVDSFSQKYNYTYIVRVHPNFRGDEYNDIIGNRGVVCSKTVNLEEFFNSIEFAVVANSTALFELEDYKMPYLHYSSNNAKDKYKDYDTPSFGTLEQMESLFLQNQHITWIKQLPQISAKVRYFEFFSNFTK